MKFYCISIKSKTALMVFLSLIVVFLVCVECINVKADMGSPIITNEDRINCINSFGYQVLPDAVEVKEIVIPEKFSDVYENYNQLQLKSGYNLKKYSGMDAAVYKYKLQDCAEETYINIIICEGVLIGGDVSTAKIGGEMQPLKRKT